MADPDSRANALPGADTRGRHPTMKTLILPALLVLPLASCAALTSPRPYGPPLGAGGSKLTLFFGERELEEDDYAPVEEQETVGAALSWEPAHGGLGGELGVLSSEEEETVLGLDVEGKTLEVFGGVRQNFGSEALRPYLGGGLSWIESEVESGPLTDDDDSLGLYLHAGIDAWVTPNVSLGVEYRLLLGTDMDVFGVETDADYEQVGVTLGFSF